MKKFFKNIFSSDSSDSSDNPEKHNKRIKELEEEVKKLKKDLSHLEYTISNKKDKRVGYKLIKPEIFEAYDNIKDYRLCINWVDKDDLKRFEIFVISQSLLEFRRKLIIAKTITKEDRFCTLSVHLNFNNGNDPIVQFITKTDDTVLSSNELPELINTIIEEIDKKPELLI